MEPEVPDQPHAPRPDAAAPAWYPHPRRPGALRYWNGLAWVEADAAAGWYPDPADRGALRFWDGSAWGEVLADDPSAPAVAPLPVPRPAAAPAPAPAPSLAPGPATAPAGPAPAPIPAVAPNPRLADASSTPSRAWVTSVLAVACLVAGTVVGGVVVSTVSGDGGPSATRTVTATATGTGSPEGAAAATAGSGLVVARVLSSRTVELKGDEGKVEVRLLGLGATACDTNRPGKDLLKSLLRDAVVGRSAVVSTLSDPRTGDVGAYIDVDGQDVGELLISAGLATAEAGHPRAPAYARAAAAATPYCTGVRAPASTPASPATSSATTSATTSAAP